MYFFNICIKRDIKHFSQKLSILNCRMYSWRNFFKFQMSDLRGDNLYWKNSQSLLQLIMKHVNSSKGYINHLLNAVRPVSMLMILRLNIYCNCFINKTLFLIPRHFLLFVNTLHFSRSLLHQNCLFMYNLLLFVVWPLIVEIIKTKG